MILFNKDFSIFLFQTQNTSPIRQLSFHSNNQFQPKVNDRQNDTVSMEFECVFDQ